MVCARASKWAWHQKSRHGLQIFPACYVCLIYYPPPNFKTCLHPWGGREGGRREQRGRGKDKERTEKREGESREVGSQYLRLNSQPEYFNPSSKVLPKLYLALKPSTITPSQAKTLLPGSGSVLDDIL